MIKIDYLANHPEFLAEVSYWLYSTWGYNNADCSSLEVARKYLESASNYRKLPLALIAMKGPQVIGTVTLKLHEMDNRLDLLHWMGFLFVEKTARGRGVAAALIDDVISKAASLEIDTIYLYTRDQESLYEHLGWRVVERTNYHGGPVVLMKKIIGKGS